jgi:hypothetical protein
MSNEEFVRLGLRAAVMKVRLMENELTAIGVSLKNGLIGPEGVMQWLHEEGLMFLMPDVFNSASSTDTSARGADQSLSPPNRGSVASPTN